MLFRLIFGLIKGIVIGGLIGFGLSKIGFAAPGAFIGYLSAALTGALVGLIAGKPIWAQGGRIEAGLKAGFGALAAAGLLWLVRSYVTLGIPFDLGALAEANKSLHESGAHGSLGGLAVTSLAMVGGLLGGFYDADNTPAPPDEKEKDASTKKRVEDKKPASKAGKSAASDLDLEFEDEVESKPRAKR